MTRRAVTSRAFTLVELLVVIVILGILIAIAVPSFIGTRNKAYDSQAQSSVTVAQHNAKALWVDEETYVSADDLGSRLRLSEPGLAFKTTSTFADQGPETIFVDVVDAGSTVVLCSESQSGRWFCITENAEGALQASFGDSSDTTVLAATSTVARSWGLSLGDALCHLPSASAARRTDCQSGGTAWGEATGEPSEAESQSETQPTVQILSGPLTETTLTDASIDWETSGTITATECKIDGGDYQPCSSPLSAVGISSGPHLFTVRVIGPGGSNTATHPWTVFDQPTITITSHPQDPGIDGFASSFGWSITGATTFAECRVDSEPFAECPGGAITYLSGLSVGAHVFDVRVSGPAGGQDAASFSWLIASTTYNTSDPSIAGSAYLGQVLTAHEGTWTGSPYPTFTYQWQRNDGGWANIPGATTATYTTVGGDVGHQIRVVVTGTNPVSSSSPNSAPTSSIQGAPTASITSAPAGTSAQTAAEIAFTVTGTATQTECRVDSGTWVACSSPYSFSGLGFGTHTASVRVSNPGGSNTATTDAWTVAGYQATVAASGPHHYYKMDEAPSNLVSWDSYGGPEGYGIIWNNYDQTSGDARIGAGAYGYGRHMFGFANTFGAIGGYTPVDFTQSFTVEFWMRWNGGNDQHMFSFGTSALGKALHVAMFSDGRLRFGFLGDDLDTAGGVVSVGVPTHVIVTYDLGSDTSRIYVNGVKRAEGNQGPLVASSPVPASFRIGSFVDGSRNFQGVLDELATYDRALSPAEALRHYPAQNLPATF